METHSSGMADYGSKMALELEDDESRTYKVDTKNPSEGYCSPTRKKLLVALIFIIVLVVIILLVVFLTHTSQSSEGSKEYQRKCETKGVNRVILISMDGFRPDYLTRGITPNILRLAKNGVRAEFLQPQFPTKTFPNHYSMATGLYPAVHGIVANKFTDPSLNDSFRIGGKTVLDPKWWGGEPVWMTAEKQGLTAACYFWVGSEVKGNHPSIFFYYNQSHPFPERVDTILRWLDLPAKGTRGKRRPDLITAYFHEPDYTGHRSGPSSPKVDVQIKLVDDMIGRLYEGLKDRSLEDEVDIVLVSDHGMAQTSCQRVVYLDKYNVTLNDVYTPQKYGGAFVSMSPKSGVSVEDVVDRLQCKNPHMKVFTKEELPKRLHYSNSTRIGKVLVIPEDGWLVGTNSSAGFRYCDGGAHGYDNMDRDMRTLFVAHGPSFKKGAIVEHFQNIQIYNLITGLLGLKPAPNDGTPGSLSHLLDRCSRPSVPKPTSDGNLFRSDICQFPRKEDVDKRHSCKYCICPYCKVKKDDVVKYDNMMDFSKEKVSLLQKRHLPWGLPEGGAGERGCILTQEGFVTGYSTYLHIPLWVAHHLIGKDTTVWRERLNCFRRDVRLTDAQASNCTNYYKSSFDRGHMVPFADLKSRADYAVNSFLLSNVAPMYHSFNAGIWLSAEKMVRSLSVNFSSVHVISGSIFDENADGLRDHDTHVSRWLKNATGTVAIPTHFYKIITRCDESKTPYYEVPNCRGRLDVISFILPHSNKARCKGQTPDEYLSEHMATVRDIEQLTGINFFSDLPAEEQARIKTISPVKLWHS